MTTRGTILKPPPKTTQSPVSRHPLFSLSPTHNLFRTSFPGCSQLVMDRDLGNMGTFIQLPKFK